MIEFRSWIKGKNEEIDWKFLPFSLDGCCGKEGKATADISVSIWLEPSSQLLGIKYFLYFEIKLGISKVVNIAR